VIYECLAAGLEGIISQSVGKKSTPVVHLLLSVISAKLLRCPLFNKRLSD